MTCPLLGVRDMLDIGLRPNTGMSHMNCRLRNSMMYGTRVADIKRSVRPVVATHSSEWIAVCLGAKVTAP